MKICKICVMNETIAEFKLDKESVCNFCSEWSQQKNNFLNFSKQEEINNLTKIKKNT